MKERVLLTFAMLFFALSSWAQGAQSIDMPEMPSMPAMPSMPSTDEPMAGRKALEARMRQQGAHGSAPKAAKQEALSGGKDALHGANDGEAVPPAPSSSSPISSFGTPLSDYSDIDELLRRLSAQKDTATEAAVSPSASIPDAQEAVASILRFVINGSDVRATCRNVHFSKLEADGSFLLTAERRYWAGKSPKIESFYMLFTASSGGGAGRYYDVTCSVVQDEKDDASFLSRLASMNALTATKTGNLVTLRANDEGFSADLLLDIGQ